VVTFISSSPAHIFPSPANGAPLHLVKPEASARPNRAQSFSLLTHTVIIVAFALLATHTPGGVPKGGSQERPTFHLVPLPTSLLDRLRSGRPSESRAGGDENPIPATRGILPPLSSVQWVRPSLPPKQETQLPVPPAIFDPKAAPVLTPTDHIGLPWMKNFTDSPGPGKGHTIGNSDGDTIGDSTNGPGGQGTSQLPYQPGGTLPKCAYCPNPSYTDEAREAKLQGTVMLEVLVRADGRASQIRITKGIGLGLDDRAVEAVRDWRFVPAHDRLRRPVPAWVMVEAVFRLF
jgi:protein TonB